MVRAIRAVAVAILAAGASAQAAVIPFDLQGKAGLGLLSGNENGPILGNPGSGGEIGAGIFYDDVANLLTINIGWGSGNGFTDLNANASVGHIHGPTTDGGAASFLQTVGVMIGLDTPGPSWNTSATNGFFQGTRTLTDTQEGYLKAGRLYINVHTPAPFNPGGEIRGNLVMVPEPGTWALMVAGLGGLLLLVRRRKN